MSVPVFLAALSACPRLLAAEEPAFVPPTPADVATAVPQADPFAPLTASDVAGEPTEDQVSGRSVPALPEGDGWRWVPRALLLYPRLAIEIPMMPVRAGLYVYERYELRDRIRQIFFNDAGTFGAYPTALFDTGIGLNVGARIVHTDLFGAGERLRLRASYGGEFRQFYSAKLDAGARFHPWRPSVEAAYRLQPDAPFYGIGNNEDAPMPPDGLAPPVDGPALPARFGQETTSLMIGLRRELATGWAVRASSTFTLREFEGAVDLDRGERQLAEVYETADLTSYDAGVRTLSGDLSIAYRSVASAWTSTAIPVRGWDAEVFGGYVAGVDGDRTRYARWGLHATRFVAVLGGDRVLSLRVTIDGVAGPLDRIPFVDLPRLGGPALLRGIDRDRYRDRILALGTAEYAYPVNDKTRAFLFVDVGRVYRTLDEATPEGLHLGFGAGLRLYTARHFLAHFGVASSVDGGLFVNLTLDPGIETYARFDAP